MCKLVWDVGIQTIFTKGVIGQTLTTTTKQGQSTASVQAAAILNNIGPKSLLYRPITAGSVLPLP